MEYFISMTDTYFFHYLIQKEAKLTNFNLKIYMFEIAADHHKKNYLVASSCKNIFHFH